MDPSNLDDRRLRELSALLSNQRPDLPDDEQLRDLITDFFVAQADVAGMIHSAIGGNQVRLGAYDPEESFKRIVDYDTTNLSTSDQLLLAEWKREAEDVMTAARYIRTAKW
jgi:hypothetical protein